MPSKKPKQQSTVSAELLFHESIGRDLSDKYISLVGRDDKNGPLAKYFVSGTTEEQLRPYQPFSAGLQNSTDSSVSVTELSTTGPKGTTVKDRGTVNTRSSKNKTAYNLDELNASAAIEHLVSHYGRMTHMGVRDHSYQFYLNQSRTGVISYRLMGKVAVISGDPICPTWRYRNLLGEFEHYCRSHHWKFAMNGCSDEMATIAKGLGWATIHIARERAIDVQNNPVLLGSEGKRIRTQCKQLMKSGTSLGIYSPTHQRDLHIEEKLGQIYEDWRAERNSTKGPQAYVTVFDMFSLSRMMTFVYTYDSQGTVSGFAALRKMKNGYHVDPCIAATEAPRGTVDLLLVGSMALLKKAGVERLALGVEPLDELGEVSGMSKTMERLTRKSHKLVTLELSLGGKKGFNDRFRPEESLEEQLFLVYPNAPGFRQQVAIAHFSNVELHKALKQRYSREFDNRVKSIWRRKDETSPRVAITT